MSYTRDEMETCIAWSDATKTACVYTASPVSIRKLDKLCAEHPDVYQCVWSEPGDTAKKYQVPSKYVRFGKPASAAQTEARQRNMVKMHSVC